MKVFDNKPYRSIFILILLVGALLRFHHLSRESLWLDEGHSVRMAGLPVFKMVQEIAANKHPPLYFLALHGWIRLFGDSEFSVRSLSVIFGILSIVMLYQTASLLFGKKTGLLAALLLTLSSFNLFYSQEARMYTLLTFLSLGSMYYFIKWLSGGKKWSFTCYLVFSMLLIYTQNFGIFIILAQNLYLVSLLLRPASRAGTHLKSWIVLQGVLLVLYLPWMGILIRQILSIDAASWRVLRPSWEGLWFSFQSFSGSRWLLWLSIPPALYAVISVTIRSRAEADGGGDASRRRWIIGRDTERVYLLLVWLFALVLLPFLISQFTSSIYVHRATVVATLPWYILVGRGIDKIRFKYLRLFIIIVIIGFSLVNIKEYFAEEKKDQWREAVGYMDARAEDGDLIYVYGGSPLFNIFFYYYRKSGLPNRRIVIREMPITGLSAEEITSPAKEFDRVWVLLSHAKTEESQRVRKRLENDYYLMRRKRYFNYSQDQFHRPRVGLIVYQFLRKDIRDESEGRSLRCLLSSLRSHSSWNLVRDPGFERPGDDWEKWAATRLVQESAYSRSNAVHVDKDIFPTANFWHLRQLVTVPRGTEYIFGAHVKTRGLSADLTVELKDPDGDRYHRYCTTNRITGDNDWTLLLGPFEPGPGDDPVRIEIRPGRMLDFREGEFWVDDVFIVPIDRVIGDWENQTSKKLIL